MITKGLVPLFPSTVKSNVSRNLEEHAHRQHMPHVDGDESTIVTAQQLGVQHGDGGGGTAGAA